MSKCVECGKEIAPDKDGKEYWFCSMSCAAYCYMWTARKGTREPDEAMTLLALRHKETGNKEDLERIEKILERINCPSSSVE